MDCTGRYYCMYCINGSTRITWRDMTKIGLEDSEFALDFAIEVLLFGRYFLLNH
jgi:hypothetical protein